MPSSAIRDSNIYLIGGPARVGKTTLSRRLIEASPAELVHLDHLLPAVSALADQPALAALNTAPSINDHRPQQWIDHLRHRDHTLWTAAKAYIATAHRNASSLVMEGGLWPDWTAQLEIKHAAVFLIDTGDSEDRLVSIAKKDPHSWMARRQWSEAKIRRWAEYNRFRSETIAKQAEEHGYPVFDISHGQTCAQDQALRTLQTYHVPTKHQRRQQEMPSNRLHATQDAHNHLNETAHRLFGQTATITDITIDTTGQPSAFTINYDHTAAHALTDPQRKRHVEWSLRQTLDPTADGNPHCTWDNPGNTLRWERHGMTPLKPHPDRPHRGYCYPDCGCPDNDFDWDGFAADINRIEPDQAPGL